MEKEAGGVAIEAGGATGRDGGRGGRGDYVI